MTETSDLAKLAEAWLAGWDAAEAGRSEKACPFLDTFATMWVRGWHAGKRREPADRKAKARFVAVSIGLNADPKI